MTSIPRDCTWAEARLFESRPVVIPHCRRDSSDDTGRGPAKGFWFKTHLILLKGLF